MLSFPYIRQGDVKFIYFFSTKWKSTLIQMTIFRNKDGYIVINHNVLPIVQNIAI